MFALLVVNWPFCIEFDLICFKKLADLACYLSEQPAVGGVEKRGEWYRDKNEKKVAASQTRDEHVRLGSHPLVGEDCVYKCAVADQSQDKYDAEHYWNDDTADEL